MNISFGAKEFFVIKNFCKKEDLQTPISKERGEITYFDNRYDSYLQKIDYKNHIVPYSLTRYNFPFYKPLSTKIKNYLEEKIKTNLELVTFYDRYYFENQKLNSYRTNDEIDILVIINISKNFKKNCAINIDDEKINLNATDALFVNLKNKDCSKEKIPKKSFFKFILNFLFKKPDLHEVCFAFKLC